jgi:hypothetical protein
MKHILLLIFSFLFLQVARAQSPITIEPNPVTNEFSEDLSDMFLDLESYATITNTTNETVSLRWTRVVQSTPTDWETQVCDNVACYLPQVSSNIDPELGLNAPFELEAGESFELIFHVLPYGTAGEGRFELIFALTSAPDAPIDTAFFEVNVVENTTTSTFDATNTSVRLYPNPTTDYFELTDATGIDRLVVYNLLGRAVRSFRAVRGERYSLGGLPDGLYLVSLQNRDKALKTVRLNKRSWRP